MRQITLVLVTLVVSFSAIAEEIYINDQLRVGVRPEPNNSEAPIAVVTTGDKMEVLDSVTGYLKIRTSQGEEGWIKEIYTTHEIPAIIRLQALSKSTSGEGQKLQTLQKQVSVMEQANTVLNDELETIKEEKRRIQLELMNTRISDVNDSWIYWLLGLIVVAISGFLFGKYWHQQQITKRLGGLRI